ncbi:MAG: MotA/TolQ/ExbB proton channel family protein [Bdellovibrionales bacterium]
MFENCTESYNSWIAVHFCQGGFVMLLIGVIFLLTLFLIIERFIALSKLGVDKASVASNIRGMLLRGDVRQAITFCDKTPAPLTNTIQAGLVQVLNRRPDEEVQVAMDASVLRETPRLEGWVSFLAVFGNVAVLVGLLGTIIGMIKSFGGVASADQAEKAQILAEGISEALNCTAFGLFVAILAIVTYGFFQIKISRTTNDMLETSMDVMNLVTANRDKIQRT